MHRNCYSAGLSNFRRQQPYRGHLEKLVAGLLLAALLASLPALAQQAGQEQKKPPAASLKIAIVDIERIQREYEGFAQANQKLDEMYKRYGTILRELQRFMFLPQDSFREVLSILQLPKPLPADKQKRLDDLAKLSAQKERRYLDLQAKTNRTQQEEDEFQTLQETYKSRQRDISQLDQRYSDEFQRARAQMLSELEKKVLAAVAAVAARLKYDLVFNRLAVLYGGNDITDAVLEQLRKPAQPAGQGGGGGGGK